MILFRKLFMSSKKLVFNAFNMFFKTRWLVFIISYVSCMIYTVFKCTFQWNPAGTWRCDNIVFCLSFGCDVGKRRINVVTTLFFRRHCPCQNLTLLQCRVLNANFPTRYKCCRDVMFLTSFFRQKSNGIQTSLWFFFAKVMQMVF